MVRYGMGRERWLVFATAVLLVVVVGAPGLAVAGDRVSVPGQRDVAVGSLVVVPVEASAELGIESASFGLEYSGDLLTPLAVYTTPLTRDFDLGFDLETPGDVSVEIRGRQPLFESGAIVWVLFRNHGAVGDRTELTLHDVLLNDADSAVLKSGYVELDAGQVVLSFATDLTAATEEVFTATMSADDVTGILAMDIRVEYDPLVLQALSVVRTPISQSFTLTPNLNTPGVIQISLFGTQPLAGSGPLLDIDFEVVGSTGQSTPIDLVSAGVNEGAIVAVFEDGFFSVCDGTDADGDTVSLCEGDCDDDDGGRFPGNPEIGCDGIDQDCDALTSDILDGDNDTFACDLDCRDDIPSINPGAEEVCDGIDNDCDLGIDNVPPPVDLVQVDGIDEAGPTLSWPAVAAATGYDVLRGNLSDLRSSGGDFTQATEICLADDATDTFIDDTASPPASDGFWYLVRPANCGGSGSYESDGVSQDGLRDVEANASPQSCN